MKRVEGREKEERGPWGNRPDYKSIWNLMKPRPIKGNLHLAVMMQLVMQHKCSNLQLRHDSKSSALSEDITLELELVSSLS